MHLFLKVGNTWAAFKTFWNNPLIKERFMRLVNGFLRALLKVLNNFVGMLWDTIVLLFFSNFNSCSISFLVLFLLLLLDLRRDFSLLDFLYNLEKYVYLGDFCFYCLNNITKMLVWIFIDVFWIICMLSLSIPLIFCFCLALRFSLFQPRFYNNLVFCFQKNVIMWSLTWL